MNPPVRLVAPGLLLLGALGCGYASADICLRGDECNLLTGQSVSECSESIDDGLRDGRLESDEVARCQRCVRNDNECSEVLFECFEACSGVFAEIALGAAR